MRKQYQTSANAPSEKILYYISRALANSLESTILGAEWKFLKLGHLLQSIASQVKELSQLTQNTAGLISGNPDKSIVANVKRVARVYLAELNQYQSNISDSLRNKDIDVQYLDSLHDKCLAISRIARWLKIISLNLGIESCHSVESEGIFESLIQENKHLAVKLDGISKKIREDSMAASSALLSSNRKISKKLNEFLKIRDSAEIAMQDAAQKIITLTDFSAQALDKAAIDSKDISIQIDEIVMALQFHDIARQQVDHIATALRDLAEIAHKGTSATQEGNKRAILSRAHSILSIQVAQLARVIIGVESHYQKCKKAFREIFNKVESLATSFQVSQLSDRTQNKIEDQLTALKSGLEGLSVLFGHGRRLNGQTRETSERMFETVSELSNSVYQVRSISSMELHIRALNAIAKAARFGLTGRSFEVIAREAVDLSEESRNCHIEIIKVLEAIKLNANNYKSRENRTGEEHIQEGDRQINVTLDAEIRNIAQSYEKFIQTSSACSKRATILQTAISRVNRDLSFLLDLSAYLREHLGVMQSWLQSLEPWMCSGQEEAEPEIERIAQNYTMKEERDTHTMVSNVIPEQLV